MYFGSESQCADLAN